MVQDDEYLISVAKTEYREAYNTGDVERLLSVFTPQFTDWSEGEPSFYREEAAKALRLRATELFRRYAVNMSVIIIGIAIEGDAASERGWHKVKLTDKTTGAETNAMYRYFETWARTPAGWKINFIMTNKEHPPRMLPEEEGAASRQVEAGKAGG